MEKAAKAAAAAAEAKKAEEEKLAKDGAAAEAKKAEKEKTAKAAAAEAKKAEEEKTAKDAAAAAEAKKAEEEKAAKDAAAAEAKKAEELQNGEAKQSSSEPLLLIRYFHSSLSCFSLSRPHHSHMKVPLQDNPQFAVNFFGGYVRYLLLSLLDGKAGQIHWKSFFFGTLEARSGLRFSSVKQVPGTPHVSTIRRLWQVQTQ